MGRNKGTYLLIALVLTVWGILGFKLVKGMGGREPVAGEVPRMGTSVLDPLKKREPIVVLADYRDPFLGTMPKGAVPKKKAQKKKRATPPKRRIAYSGSVAGKETKDRLFFVSIDGRQHIMERRQEIDGVTLISGDAGSVRVRYPGHVENIKLDQ